MTDKRNNKMPWLWAWWELVFIAGKYLELKQMFYERPVGLPGSDINLAAANLFLNPPLKPQCTAHVSVIRSENIQDVLLNHIRSIVACFFWGLLYACLFSALGRIGTGDTCRSVLWGLEEEQLHLTAMDTTSVLPHAHRDRVSFFNWPMVQ